jgi:hypothetical protein
MKQRIISSKILPTSGLLTDHVNKEKEKDRVKVEVKKDRIKIYVYYQIKCHYPKSVLHNPIIFNAIVKAIT